MSGVRILGGAPFLINTGMKAHEFINEAINQSGKLTIDAYKTIREVTERYVKRRVIDILKSVPASRHGDAVDIYEQTKKTLAVMHELEHDGSKEYIRAQEKNQDQWSMLIDMVDSAILGDPVDVNMPLIQDYKSSIEYALQNLAKKHVESQLGQVVPHPKTRTLLPSDQREGYNLFWMEHVFVELIIDNDKESGGFFSPMPNLRNIKSRSAISLASTFSNSFHVQIGVYTTPRVLLNSLYTVWTYMQSEINFGEPTTEDQFMSFMEPIVHTFVHETVHLEQTARADPTLVKGMNIVHTKLPPSGSKDRGLGAVSAVNRAITSPNPSRDVVHGYLGSIIEIEAHAAHAATKKLSQLAHEARRYSRGFNPDIMKDYIDYAIDDAKYGIIPDNWYSNWIQPEIAGVISRINAGNPSNKDKNLYQVWKRYIKKYVQHLKSYKPEQDSTVDNDTWK